MREPRTDVTAQILEIIRLGTDEDDEDDGESCRVHFAASPARSLKGQGGAEDEELSFGPDTVDEDLAFV